MSKHMQLTVRILPYYKKGLNDVYPAVARRFGYLDETWVEQNPSLFEIVGGLDKLLYQLKGDPPFRELLLQHRPALHKRYEQIEEHIADWQLSKADRLLYEIEDIFDEIEGELGRIKS
jgi:hypothetical protein